MDQWINNNPWIYCPGTMLVLFLLVINRKVAGCGLRGLMWLIALVILIVGSLVTWQPPMPGVHGMDVEPGLFNRIINQLIVLFVGGFFMMIALMAGPAVDAPGNSANLPPNLVNASMIVQGGLMALVFGGIGLHALLLPAYKDAQEIGWITIGLGGIAFLGFVFFQGRASGGGQ